MAMTLCSNGLGATWAAQGSSAKPGYDGSAEITSHGERMTAAKVYPSESDARLLAFAAEGDRRAFDEIVRRHGPFALRVASRLVADVATAEDVVQEAMVRVWNQAGRFDAGRARFTTWLYRIVVNLCIDHKRRMPLLPLPETLEIEDPSAGVEDVMLADERASALREALKDLPVRQRAAISLVYDEGLSGAEAAKVLNVSAKAVERLLARGRTFLRAKLTVST